MEANNMKAMREALKELQSRLVAGVYDGSIDCHAALAVVEKALAAPARNCDRFGGDMDKLREACARERGLNPGEDFPDVFPDWLLAPATERKGDGDGGTPHA